MGKDPTSQAAPGDLADGEVPGEIYETGNGLQSLGPEALGCVIGCDCDECTSQYMRCDCNSCASGRLIEAAVNWREIMTGKKPGAEFQAWGKMVEAIDVFL